MEELVLNIPDNIPYVTPKTFGYKGLKYRDFNIDEIFVAGTNPKFFDKKKPNTWTILTFHISRSILNVLFYFVEVYRSLSPSYRDIFHDGVRLVGWLGREEVKKDEKSGEKLVSVRHVMKKDGESVNSLEDEKIEQINQVVNENSNTSTYIFGLPWIIMINVSAFQTVISGIWSYASRRLLRRFTRRRSRSRNRPTRTPWFLRNEMENESNKDSIEDETEWVTWAKHINNSINNFPNHIGTSILYEQFCQEPPPPKPRNRVIGDQVIKPRIQELEHHARLVHNFNEDRKNHSTNEINRVCKQATVFIIASALAKINQLTIFEKSGKISENITDLATMVQNIVQTKSLPTKRIVLHTTIIKKGTTDNEEDREVAINVKIEAVPAIEIKVPSTQPELSNNTTATTINEGTLHVYLIKKPLSLEQILTFTKSVSGKIINKKATSNNLTHETLSSSIRRKFLGTPTKLDMFISPMKQHSSLGFPSYGLNGSFIYQEEHHDVSAGQLLTNALKFYNENFIEESTQTVQ